MKKCVTFYYSFIWRHTVQLLNKQGRSQEEGTNFKLQIWGFYEKNRQLVKYVVICKIGGTTWSYQPPEETTEASACSNMASPATAVAATHLVFFFRLNLYLFANFCFISKEKKIKLINLLATIVSLHGTITYQIKKALCWIEQQVVVAVIVTELWIISNQIVLCQIVSY